MRVAVRRPTLGFVTPDLLAVLVVPTCFVAAGVLGIHFGTPVSISAGLLGVGATHLTAFAASTAAVDTRGLPGALLHVASQGLFGLGFVCLLWIALAFPQGSRPGRVVSVGAAAAVVFPLLGGFAGATPTVLGEGSTRGPMAHVLPESLAPLAAVPLVLIPCLTVLVFAVRLVRSSGEARRTMLWPVIGVGVVAALAAAGIVLGPAFPGAGSAAFLMAAPVVPLAVAFGPVRRRLLHLTDETSRLSADLAARVAELEDSRHRLSVATEVERRRIERDLHDGAQQELLAVLAWVDAARGAADPSRREEALQRAADLGRAAYETVRAVSHGIRPAVLDDMGLVAAIRAAVAPYPLPAEVVLHGDPARRHPAEVEGAALFLVSEALANVLRHASASRVTVEVGDAAGLEVAVHDDGRGGVDPQGSGIVGLRDRIESVGGRLVVDSSPGHSRLTAIFPGGPR